MMEVMYRKGKKLDEDTSKNICSYNNSNIHFDKTLKLTLILSTARDIPLVEVDPPR